MVAVQNGYNGRDGGMRRRLTEERIERSLPKSHRGWARVRIVEAQCKRRKMAQAS